MKIKNLLKLSVTLLLLPLATVLPQRNYEAPPMRLDISNYFLEMNKKNGEGGLISQYSWMLVGTNPQTTELFYWPLDRWQSNMLYQIFNPVVLDEKGIKDENGVVRPMYSRGAALTNPPKTDWTLETRRYRPPHLSINGIRLDQPYKWKVDPTLKSDIKLEFEDVQEQFGIRSHVEIYAFTGQNHSDYFIWKVTHKFTGEIKIPRDAASAKDTLPDQTIRFWWPISFSFGPSKAGERNALGGFSYEAEDDFDHWFKGASRFTNSGVRDSLYIAYYMDASGGGQLYSNGSKDDTGDPDRVTGHLYSTQIPGYALLHADKSYADKTDDRNQPYSMPHASINDDLWGRRDLGLKLTYRGDDGKGRFPAPPALPYAKGPMRFITVGPYELTKNKAAGRVDSITFVYAVGAGDIGWAAADSIGKLWIQKQITDQQKKDYILKGRDSLLKTLDNANWAWARMSQGKPVPTPPPPPDVDVSKGPKRIFINWSYPDPSYFQDAATGVDDWYSWRVYRKRGARLVDDPSDEKSGAKWELVYETTDRSQTTYADVNVDQGVDYYYAVTAVDNGSQNADDINPHQKLESSRFVTRSMDKIVPSVPGLDRSDLVRVVPNPYTAEQGALLSGGTPDKISFFNLPVKCTLRIFTEGGDPVKVIEHYGEAGDEWDQRTTENQMVASGIYILAVTDAKDLAGNPLPNQFVKFVIIR
ncbi:MAG: hypothetical protein ACM3S2_04185 [Ignavibacteriales bacterium]